MQKGSSEPTPIPTTTTGEAPSAANPGEAQSGKATDFGKIIRDDEGNVIRIEMDDNKKILDVSEDSTFKEDAQPRKGADALVEDVGPFDAQASKWLLQSKKKDRISGAADKEEKEGVKSDVSRGECVCAA